MIISVTERGQFRRCKRQWDYASFNRQGLTPIIPPTALSFGTLIHKCHEQWLLNPDEDVQKIVLRVGAEGLKALKERYKNIVGVEPEERELQNYFEQLELALEMMINYQKKWGSALPEGFELLQPEQTILMPIPHSEDICPTCSGLSAQEGANRDCPECEGKGFIRHYLEGTLDGLLRDANGYLWVLEHKTYGNRPKIPVLQKNDQFLAYIWLLHQLDMGPVGGLLYDGMWKRRWEKDRTLDDLFMREPIIRTPEEIANFSTYVRDEAMDMAQLDLRIYPNRSWQGCWDCSFEELCSATDRGEDVDWIRARKYTLRERHEWQEEAD